MLTHLRAPAQLLEAIREATNRVVCGAVLDLALTSHRNVIYITVVATTDSRKKTCSPHTEVSPPMSGKLTSATLQP